MYIQAVPAGPVETNAYLVADEESGDALIIDAPPGGTADLLDSVAQHSFTVRAIVLTHHHWDHVVDTLDLKAATGAPVLAHPVSVPHLESPRPPAMVVLDSPISPVTPDGLLNDGDTLSLGRYTFQVIHTPGHAPGQISLYEPEAKVLFGGDTLFAQGYGRVDLPGASVPEMIATMRRLLELPDDVTVYPGHGAPTTIGAERPWISQIVERR